MAEDWSDHLRSTSAVPRPADRRGWEDAYLESKQQEIVFSRFFRRAFILGRLSFFFLCLALCFFRWMKIKLFDPACRDRTADRTSGNKSEGCRCDRKASHFCIISQSPATLFSDMYFAYHLCPFFWREVPSEFPVNKWKHASRFSPCYRDSRQGLAQARTLARCPQKSSSIFWHSLQKMLLLFRLYVNSWGGIS